MRTLRGLQLRCPPLPQTLLRALDLIDKPEKLDVEAATELVQRDPIVVARLLHTVNSAYYGLRHTISSADRAVVMLGPIAVAGIVLGMHMLKLRSVLEGPAGACFQRLIRHSIACAFLSRHMLEGMPREATATRIDACLGLAFTSGLLHDFGKIILVYNFEEEAIELYDEDVLASQVAAQDDREFEQLLFGCDHTEAGEFAARKLCFPDVLVDVIRRHHDPFRHTLGTESHRLIRITAAADLAARATGYAFGAPEERDTLHRSPLWSLLVELNDVRHGSPAKLVDDLLSQQEHLDEYVERLTSQMPSPESGTSVRLA